MADIKDFIDLMGNVGNAMVGVHKFIYGDRAQIDAFQSKQYPVILAERNVPLTTFNIEKNQSRYNIRVQFYDTYHRAQEAQNNDQAPQKKLQLVAYQYLKELRKQLDGTKTRIVSNELTGGSFAFNVGSDKLLRLEVILPVEIFGECSEGQFNYV